MNFGIAKFAAVSATVIGLGANGLPWMALVAAVPTLAIFGIMYTDPANRILPPSPPGKKKKRGGNWRGFGRKEAAA